MDFNLIPDSMCDQCHTKGTLGIERAPTPGYDSVFELSIVCQQCGRREHSCWTNALLDNLADKKNREIDPRQRMKLVRRHQRAFALFQDEMTRAMALTRSA